MLASIWLVIETRPWRITSSVIGSMARARVCSCIVKHRSGVAKPLHRHGRACPGHPRLDCSKEDVDARPKAGHDGGEIGAYLTRACSPPRPNGDPNFAKPSDLETITGSDQCGRSIFLDQCRSFALEAGRERGAVKDL